MCGISGLGLGTGTYGSCHGIQNNGKSLDIGAQRNGIQIQTLPVTKLL